MVYPGEFGDGSDLPVQEVDLASGKTLRIPGHQVHEGPLAASDPSIDRWHEENMIEAVSGVLTAMQVGEIDRDEALNEISYLIRH